MNTANNNTRFPYLVTWLLAAGLSLLSAPLHAVQSITYYHWDALGSPVAATDEAGNLKWREEYQPYGEKIQNQPQAQTNTRWYTGHPHDNATGLTYMGARWYDPVVGRFMAIDPKDFAEGNVHSFNRYNYANNNPYSFTDPDGRSPKPNLWGALIEFLKELTKAAIEHKLEHGAMEQAKHQHLENVREGFGQLELADQALDTRYQQRLSCDAHGGSGCWNGWDQEWTRLNQGREFWGRQLHDLGEKPWSRRERYHERDQNERERFRSQPETSADDLRSRGSSRERSRSRDDP